jgi:hypothetical protein
VLACQVAHLLSQFLQGSISRELPALLWHNLDSHLQAGNQQVGSATKAALLYGELLAGKVCFVLLYLDQHNCN